MQITIHKFGGASIQNADAIRKLVQIIRSRKTKDEANTFVFSAMAKTTNALEEVVQAHYAGKQTQSFDLLNRIRNWHEQVSTELFAERSTEKQKILEIINDLCVEVEWLLEEDPPDNYDFLYDQVVPLGELLSSQIVAGWLRAEGLPVVWTDARDFIRTGEGFREARLLWDATRKAVQENLIPLLEKKQWPLTQGFIGATSDNYSTTLGREGSDYTAAILGHCLNARKVIIWKDVPGVLTADPRVFKNPQLLQQLSYREAIEMTYYGAQVLHPKTIKPLQNKGIPLEVRSFLQPGHQGSIIHAEAEEIYPPIVSIEKEQVLLQISTLDFSFIAEQHISFLFERIARLRLRVNLMQNSAISFSLCLSKHEEKINHFVKEIQQRFKVQIQKELELINIRHATPETREKLLKNRLVLLEQRLGNTMQMVVKKLPPIEYAEEM